MRYRIHDSKCKAPKKACSCHKRCSKCGEDLSYREHQLCFVCHRIANDKSGIATTDTIRYDS